MSYRPITKEELPHFLDLVSQGFREDAHEFAEWYTRDDARYTFRECRVWETEARGMVAGLALFERECLLNGVGLPAGLVAGVVVPPEHRRQGFAVAMLDEMLKECYARKLPLSLLFPYSIPFYNRLGYGIVSYAWYLEFPLDQLTDFDERSLVRRMTPEHLPAMQRLYEQERKKHNGWFNRSAWDWQENLMDLSGRRKWPRKVEGMVIPGEGDELLGYLTYTLANAEDGSQSRVLSIREWVNDSTDPTGWRALAGFVAAQRAQAHFLRYTAPLNFPLLHTLRERKTFRQRRATEFEFRDTLIYASGMMGRIIHLEEALRQRPYPQAITGECLIQMRDPQLPANEAPHYLNVANGQATVACSQPAHPLPSAIADVRTWSEIYAGTLSAEDARLVKRLECDASTASFLTALFACRPWYIHATDWF